MNDRVVLRAFLPGFIEVTYESGCKEKMLYLTDGNGEEYAELSPDSEMYRPTAQAPAGQNGEAAP